MCSDEAAKVLGIGTCTCRHFQGKYLVLEALVKVELVQPYSLAATITGSIGTFFLIIILRIQGDNLSITCSLTRSALQPLKKSWPGLSKGQ